MIEIPDNVAIAGFIGWMIGMICMWLMQRELRGLEKRETTEK